MAATLMVPATLDALATLVSHYPLQCERIVVSERIEAIAIVGDLQLGRRLCQVCALVVLPGEGVDDLGMRAVSFELEVAFPSCAGGF